MIKIKRWINPIDLKYMKSTYGTVFNVDNIQTINKFKAWKIFGDEDKKIVEQFKFFVLNKFIVSNYETSIKFAINLKKIIRHLDLSLDERELQEIRLLDERVFSLQRHIKELKSNLPLAYGELIGIKFIAGELFKKTDKLSMVIKGDILVSNNRIIFYNSNKQINFYWRSIKNKQAFDYGYQFEYMKKIYIIRIHDSETFNNTLENYLSKINVR